MTQTIQPRSIAYLNKTKKININKPETEDNNSLFLSVLDSMNNLYTTLSRLNYLMERKIIEQNLYRKCKGEEK